MEFNERLENRRHSELFRFTTDAQDNWMKPSGDIVRFTLNESMNHEGENMDVINQGELYHILKASQASQKRRNENAEGERKREDAKKRYVRYFSRIFAGSSGDKTSEQNP